MTNLKKQLIPLTFILASFVVAVLAIPYMPYLMASHWGISGQVDGYMSRNFGLFFMPCLSLVLYILFLFLPQLDPYKKNFSQFEHHYHNFMIVIFSFLLYIYLLTIVWNFGYRFNMIQLLSPAFSILFYFTGILTGKAKMNWFVGFRTPWTMSSPKVWQKTHEIGSKLFKSTALISLLGTLWPSSAFYFLFVPLIFTSLFVFVYSYLLYSRYNQA